MNGNILCLAKALPQESLAGLELLGRAERAFTACRYHSRWLGLCSLGISEHHCCAEAAECCFCAPCFGLVSPACVTGEDCPGKE